MENRSFGYSYRTVKIAVLGRNCFELNSVRNFCSSSSLKVLADVASGYTKSLPTSADG